MSNNKIEYFTKTEGINSKTDDSLLKYISKHGEDGRNRPDIKLFIQSSKKRKISVMIEVKGNGNLQKLNANGSIDNYTKNGNFNFKNIDKYTLNEVIHYVSVVLSKRVFAINKW